ncbi:hypothetical protein [Vallitalea guaymasensis]|uniref:Uncharacterized protein n=1 Tax=Vallitalea guaymasensis TaxID=1185412 RepID=A0A8J8MBM0_9FIRM|nr:hypothetical protein [Vallitalea guaymasensis]QUH29999.1 hypothetical protein HYG85_14180 [Vallitalea guaymasensis]
MPQYTSNMDLYKVDLETDGNSTFNIMTMLNDNWDKIDSKYDEQEERIRGNSEVVNEVKEDVGGWKIYNNITELGLTIGSETIVDICEAMPDKSELRFMKITTNPSTAYPMASGILNIRKYSSYRTEVRFVWGYDNKTKEWIGYYDTNIEPNFSGWKCIEEKLDDIAYKTVGGTANNITVTKQGFSLTDGQYVEFKTTANNTGNMTLDVNSLGVISLRDEDSEQLSSGDIEANKYYKAIYDATQGFFVLAPRGGGAEINANEGNFIISSNVNKGDALFFDELDRAILSKKLDVNMTYERTTDIVPSSNVFGGDRAFLQLSDTSYVYVFNDGSNSNTITAQALTIASNGVATIGNKTALGIGTITFFKAVGMNDTQFIVACRNNVDSNRQAVRLFSVSGNTIIPRNNVSPEAFIINQDANIAIRVNDLVLVVIFDYNFYTFTISGNTLTYRNRIDTFGGGTDYHYVNVNDNDFMMIRISGGVLRLSGFRVNNFGVVTVSEIRNLSGATNPMLSATLGGIAMVNDTSGVFVFREGSFNNSYATFTVNTSSPYIANTPIYRGAYSRDALDSQQMYSMADGAILISRDSGVRAIKTIFFNSSNDTVDTGIFNLRNISGFAIFPRRTNSKGEINILQSFGNGYRNARFEALKKVQGLAITGGTTGQQINAYDFRGDEYDFN